ncbi:enoyl-CoA hydratase [Virgibacillus dakarensis]|uniref:Enoyl-CoA hydratase n=1 Tax=Lentibacillus populi TaxID=1827502 RepID=A0A9W5TU50_9BACI|nr:MULTISPECIES: enoyl-CoA hydratase [Bacillaceae]MBT2215191.1 enoyl-CoA hydratase [Virgibacillus dakarensis]MTW84243.1 enoyl-CoA hydratase [Virgibacillus dakarensis]GGB27928.1 putative enoyl-CoA hydratase [Lentibacillus populi]
MGTLSYEAANHVATLTIQSPPANALSSALLQDLSEKLDEIEKNETIKAVILKGEGRFFSAGADIKEFTSLQKASDYQSLSEKGQQLFARVEHFPIPVIAAIHGAALGGGLELAMSCHIRIVAENAKLGLPELTLGIIPGFAGTQRLPRYVGTAKAYEMILSGEPISGKEASGLGLANQAVAEADVLSEATKLAEKIAAKSKPSITRVMNLVPYAITDQFTAGVKAEAAAFGEVFGSEDAKEGVQAFIEKRKPDFQDK